MFCGKCGTKIKEGDSFCTNCGAKISLETPKKMTGVNNGKIEIQSITSRFIKYWEDKYPGKSFDSSYEEFKEYAKDGYKKEIEKVLNSTLDNDSKIEKINSIYYMIDTDIATGEDLQRRQEQSNDNNSKEFFIPEDLGWIYDDASEQIEGALHTIYEEYYKNNKEVCDKLITEIDLAVRKYENEDTDWMEENIPNYKGVEFDFVRLAQNMLSEKKYTQTQILSSFYKRGNEISVSQFRKGLR